MRIALDFDFDDHILIVWGALTNLEYTMKVADTETGEVKTYHNTAGTYCGGSARRFLKIRARVPPRPPAP